MRIAITGGAGFIGSHVVDHLLAAGHVVVVIDSRCAHRPDVEHTAADLRDLDALVTATRGCDLIFHLAAVSNVNDVFDHPVDAVDVNVTGTARVLEAGRRNDVERVFFASTVWVYGAAVGEGDLDEDALVDTQIPSHLYTASKIASELVIQSYAELYDLPFTILRYGVPFGPRMRDELVIPRFVRMALEDETITVSGDGLQFRNYVYVEDLAEAHVLALDPTARGEVFNLEGPQPVSIRAVVETLEVVLGRRIAVEYGPARPGDFRGRPVSGRKADKMLDWTPRTSFEEGLRRYVEWYTAG
ncbi:MAG: UDP-glucose 4-epimerase [Actinomycetota bacterium]|nr:UDP-glucose 4-epimerase [Actinomycetota bacterium]